MLLPKPATTDMCPVGLGTGRGRTYDTFPQLLSARRHRVINTGIIGLSPYFRRLWIVGNKYRGPQRKMIYLLILGRCAKCLFAAVGHDYTEYSCTK